MEHTWYVDVVICRHGQVSNGISLGYEFAHFVYLGHGLRNWYKKKF